MKKQYKRKERHNFMIRFLARTALTLLANAAGLLVAALLLPGFHIQLVGFIVSVLFFTGFEVLLEPFVLKMAIKYIPALRGGIALVTTFAGLFVTVIFTSGLRIDNLSTWVLAPMIIWIFAIVANIVLPMFLFKKVLGEIKENRSAGSQN